ncbi:hypothetical protein FHG87_019244 [Trinorchestia longiramus]|nr:hypothetical protein FHG87_019244 [Trinorchestia longiramus]
MKVLEDLWVSGRRNFSRSFRILLEQKPPKGLQGLRFLSHHDFASLFRQNYVITTIKRLTNKPNKYQAYFDLGHRYLHFTPCNSHHNLHFTPCNSHHCLHFTPCNIERRLQRLELISLEQRRLRGQLIETFKYLNGLNNVTLEGLFERDGNVRTRNNDQKLLLRNFKTSQAMNFFPVKIAATWNQLPENIVSAGTVNTFKNRLDKFWITNPPSITSY